VGTDLEAARRVAAQTNAQLQCGDPAVLTFEPVSIPELRQRWLDHHEHVLRSSVQTVSRYRTATQHLLDFLNTVRPVKLASAFGARDAETFARHLRAIEVAPNGHKNSKRRPLLDKGIKYILESCRAMFSYAAKRRHLSAYADNPFTAIEIDRIPVLQGRPIILFTPEQEIKFLEQCDDWQFSIFLTLMLTGLRPGELCHLLLPDDLDLEQGLVRVRNKADLGWQVKTRAERDVPLVPVLAEVLQGSVGARSSGPVFRQPSCERMGHTPPLAEKSGAELRAEAERRVAAKQLELGRALRRAERLAVLRTVWRDVAALKEDRVRLEFIRVTRRAGITHATAPKLLRHLFATALQETNTDPLVRNVLMGHAAGQAGRPGAGLGMTAVYTHTRWETVRRQLEAAMAQRPAVSAARARLILEA
jgi:integrase